MQLLAYFDLYVCGYGVFGIFLHDLLAISDSRLSSQAMTIIYTGKYFSFYRNNPIIYVVINVFYLFSYLEVFI